MKSILMPIPPKYVAKILSGNKTIEIRITAPKCDLPIDVYIYCTKSGVVVEKDCGLGFPEPINGKVVAKFTLRKIEQINFNGYFHPNDDEYTTETMGGKQVMSASHLSINDLVNYLKSKGGYAWHISDLEIFDEPKDLSEFGTFRKIERGGPVSSVETYRMEFVPLKKAPKSWQYVEKGA